MCYHQVHDNLFSVPKRKDWKCATDINKQAVMMLQMLDFVVKLVLKQVKSALIICYYVPIWQLMHVLSQFGFLYSFLLIIQQSASAGKVSMVINTVA